MITLFQSERLINLSDLPKEVINHIRQWPERIAPVGDSLAVLRFEWAVRPFSVLKVFNAQPAMPSFYWSSRDNDSEVVGLQFADQIRIQENDELPLVFETIETRILPDNPRLKYFGGIEFSSGSSDSSEWSEFGAGCFVLPRFEFFRDQNDHGFAVNVLLSEMNTDDIEKIQTQFAALKFTEAVFQNHDWKAIGRQDIPNESAWKSVFKSAMQKLGEHQLDKVVLARKTEWIFDADFSPLTILQVIKEESLRCFHFYFQTSANGKAFLGATPERLYARQGQTLLSEAIAGTKPRGMNPENDYRLEDELLHSPKNVHEHQFVVEHIKSVLARHCDSVHVDQQSRILSLRATHHLITTIQADLSADVSDAQLLQELHPTPAVGGTPTTEAVELISQLEPFSRGWYGGAIGVVGHDSAEFAVGIRSALVESKKISVYAGAGIVAGSTAADEWNEIENKVSTFSNIFSS